VAASNTLHQRLSALHNELLYAAQLHTSGLADPTDHGRTGVRWALAAVIKSLGGLGFGNDALKPLRAVFHALTDVDEGRRNPLLEGSTTAGRAPASTATLAIHAAAAATLQLGMAITKQQDAARAVAKALRRGGFSLPGKTKVTARAVILWRDNFSGSHGGVAGAAQYDNFVQAMQRGSATPEKQFQDALRLLTELPRRSHAGLLVRCKPSPSDAPGQSHQIICLTKRTARPGRTRRARTKSEQIENSKTCVMALNGQTKSELPARQKGPLASTQPNKKPNRDDGTS
jgi:hypothetical protein